jgi:hypothetical protein
VAIERRIPIEAKDLKGLKGCDLASCPNYAAFLFIFGIGKS